MTKEQIIISIISAVLSSSVLNGIITHILYNKKLRKEQKVRVQNMVWDKIIEALEQVRTIELEIRVQEKYNFQNDLQIGIHVDMFDGFKIYPAVMNDSSSFVKFYESINDARVKWAKYLDPKVAAYLYYMERYCLELVQYLQKCKLLKEFPRAGTVFVFDLQKWQRDYEKLLVKRINKPKHRVYTEDGRAWGRAKKKVIRKFWNRSVLNALIHDIDSPHIDVSRMILFGTDNAEEVLKKSKEYAKRHPIKKIMGKLY